MAGIFAKTSLTVGRTIAYPFAIPKRMDQSALLIGSAAHNIIGSTVQSIAALQPRFGMGVLQKVGASVQRSAAIADRNHQVFWGPVGDAFDGVGTALGSPFAYGYARSAHLPTDQKTLSALLHSPFTLFPEGGGQ